MVTIRNQEIILNQMNAFLPLLLALSSHIAEGYEEAVPVPIPVSKIPGYDLQGQQLFLQIDAAKSYKDMIVAARKDGIVIRTNYAFRTMKQQVKIHRRNRRWAAPPGLSAHQLGLAVDIAGTQHGRKKKPTKLYHWLVAHAGEYGFVQPYPGEKWHWHFIGSIAYAPELTH